MVGIKNFLIDGVSCSGKTTVCTELSRRGFNTIHGDQELAYWGDPETGEPAHVGTPVALSWLWNLEKVRLAVHDKSHILTFLCGGSRNQSRFIDLLDGVFILEIDRITLEKRLAMRPQDQWGGTASEGEEFARRQHSTREGFASNAISIDASLPLSDVVDSILRHVGWQ